MCDARGKVTCFFGGFYFFCNLLGNGHDGSGDDVEAAHVRAGDGVPDVSRAACQPFRVAAGVVPVP